MPMSFFDTTPSGRIINRFSRDTETIDSVLPGIVVQFLGCISNIITTLAIICAATLWLMIALPPIFLIYISVQRFYIPACRELQRIESITRSPIYSGLGEAVLGVETIRAYRAQAHFILEADLKAQKNADAFISQRMAACWLNMRLRFIGTGIVLLASFLVIQGKVEAGIAGLTLVYALDVTKYMEHGTNMASQLETQMNAVERVVQRATSFRALDERVPRGRFEPRPVPLRPQRGVHHAPKPSLIGDHDGLCIVGDVFGIHVLAFLAFIFGKRSANGDQHVVRGACPRRGSKVRQRAHRRERPFMRTRGLTPFVPLVRSGFEQRFADCVAESFAQSVQTHDARGSRFPNPDAHRGLEREHAAQTHRRRA